MIDILIGLAVGVVAMGTIKAVIEWYGCGRSSDVPRLPGKEDPGAPKLVDAPTGHTPDKSGRGVCEKAEPCVAVETELPPAEAVPPFESESEQIIQEEEDARLPEDDVPMDQEPPEPHESQELQERGELAGVDHELDTIRKLVAFLESMEDGATTQEISAHLGMDRRSLLPRLKALAREKKVDELLGKYYVLRD